MLTLAVWVHDLSPFVWKISGNFGIRWYGVSYLLGFILAWLLLRWMARRALIKVPYAAVSDFMLAAIVGTLIGGRLGYALIYDRDLFVMFSPAFPWWSLLNISKGGMASHGGMVGMILACVLFSRKLRQSGTEDAGTLHLMDCLGLAAPPGLLLGRLANFVNGELLGKIAARPEAPAPWWSVKFPQELADVDIDRPLSMEQIGEFQKVMAGVTDNSVAELITRIQHGDTALKSQIEPLLFARHPSQIYQAFAEGVVVFVIMWFIWRKPRKPGVMTAVFFISYGIGRIATEFWRLPDAHLGKYQRIAGLSRGQWLSVVMVVAGLALLAILRKSKQPPVGGWAKRASVA